MRRGEGAGLAGAGLGDAEQVVTFEQRRNGLGLDRSGDDIALGREGAQNVLGQAEIGKLSHKESFMSSATARARRVRKTEPLGDRPA